MRGDSGPKTRFALLPAHDEGRNTNAHDRRRRLPAQCIRRRPRRRADPDAVELAGLHPADVGAADAGADPGVSRYPLRPPRPRQIAGHPRSLFDGALWPRCAGDPRRSQYREDALVRPVDGRHGRAMARRQRAGTSWQDHPLQHRLPLSRSDQLAQPHQGSEGRRHGRGRRHRDRRLADGGFQGARTAGHREHEGDAAGFTGAGLYRLLRGAEHARPARAAAEDQEPDAGDCRAPRHLDAGVGRRIHPQQDSRRQHDAAGCRAYFQCRAVARLYRRGGRLFDATLTAVIARSEATKQFTLSLRAMDCFAPLVMTEGNSMDDNKRRDDGMTQRRKVLGNAWVDKSIANRNSFNTDFQDLITRYAWGDIWTRPHFDHRTRRVLVIGTMIALGQWDEFRLHVRAALAEGGFSPDDIKEIILQQAIYCGLPAANHAVKEASAIVQELGLLKG